MTVRLFAHRGSSAHVPEHTRAAYLRAVADGADGVECDVHLSADGEVVLIHDDTVDRTSDGTGPVADHTLAQLRALDIVSWKDPSLSADGQLLTLDELLDLLADAGRPVDLTVEFKHERGAASFLLEDTALAVLEKRGRDPETSRVGATTVSFMSFSAAAVDHLLASGVPAEHVCQLVALDHAEGLETLDDGAVGIAGPGVDFVAAHPERVHGWVEQGRTLRVWTVDDVRDARLCLDLGVGELTTNDPAALRSALADG